MKFANYQPTIHCRKWFFYRRVLELHLREFRKPRHLPSWRLAIGFEPVAFLRCGTWVSNPLPGFWPAKTCPSPNYAVFAAFSLALIFTCAIFPAHENKGPISHSRSHHHLLLFSTGSLTSFRLSFSRIRRSFAESQAHQEGFHHDGKPFPQIQRQQISRARKNLPWPPPFFVHERESLRRHH